MFFVNVLVLLFIGIIVYFFIWRNEELDLWIRQIGFLLYFSVLGGSVVHVVQAIYGLDEVQWLSDSFWLLINNQLIVVFIFNLFIVFEIMFFLHVYLVFSSYAMYAMCAMCILKLSKKIKTGGRSSYFILS